MSRSLRRSVSSRGCCVNLQAVGFAVALTTLPGFALGSPCERFIPSPTTAVSGVLTTIEVSDNTHFHIAPRAVILWGDGTSSLAVIGGPFPSIPPGFLIYNVAGGHGYSVALSGIHITVTATNLAYSCTTNNFDVGPPEPPPPPPPGNDVLSNPKLLLRGAHVNVPVMGVIAAFHDSNSSAVVSDFTAVIDWGDGTQSDGVVSSPSPGTLDVSAPSGGHTYVTRGMVTISVSLSAPGVTASVATGGRSVGRHR